jgi:hypothetical protein
MVSPSAPNSDTDDNQKKGPVSPWRPALLLWVFGDLADNYRATGDEGFNIGGGKARFG